MTTRPSVKFTYEDFILFPNDGKRHELIDGEHYVTPSPNTRHQAIVGNLHWLLRRFLEEHPMGKVFLAPFDVLFSDLDVVEPDLLFIASDRVDILTEANVQGAPDLVVEVISPSSRKTDEVTKRKLYDRHAVKEYWVVDPELEAVKVYRRKDAGFERVAELTRETRDELSTPLLPGLSLPLDLVFE